MVCLKTQFVVAAFIRGPRSLYSSPIAFEPACGPAGGIQQADAMDYLQSLRMFVKVAELRSFAGAADQFDVSSAAVTRNVASLEDRFAARLLQRTTRSVTLTDAGRLLFERVRPLVDEIDEVEGALQATSRVPAGPLRIAVQGSLGAGCVAKLLGDYRARYPSVAPQLTFTHGPVDLVEHRFDVAVFGDDYQHSGSVVVRRVVRWPQHVVASPSYATSLRAADGKGRAGQPAAPTLLTYDDPSPGALDAAVRQWLDEQWPAASRIRVNNSDVLRQLALEGMGAALVPDYLVASDLANGALLRVPTAFEPPDTGLSIAYLTRRNLAATVRTFVDFVVEAFEREPAATRAPFGRARLAAIAADEGGQAAA